MRSLWDALPSGRRGGYAEDSAATRNRGARRGARGRCRHGQGIARFEDGTYRQGADPPILASGRRFGVGTRLTRCSTGSPISPARSRSSTCFAISRCAPAARCSPQACSSSCSAVDHRSPARRAGQGPADPRPTGRKSHFVKAGTPTMGGLMILLGIVVATLALGQSAQSLCLDRARGDARLRHGRLLRRLSEGDAADHQRASAARSRLSIEAVIADRLPASPSPIWGGRSSPPR